MDDFQHSTLGINWDKSFQNCYLIRVSGRLELTESVHLEETVTDKFKKIPLHIALDMQDIHFMSSSGIRALIAIRRLTEAENCKLVLFNIPPNVQKILRIVEVAHLFEIYDTESAAIERLK